MGESVFSTMRNSPRTRTSGSNGRSAGSGWVNIDELAAGAASFADIVGAVSEIRRLESEIRELGAAHSSILISGESGTGKEMLAKALHSSGMQPARSLVVINCACLNEARPGVNPARDLREIVEQKDGGTILFDHIGELSPEAQQTLSDTLQRTAANGVTLRSRIMATSSRDIRDMASRGLFRCELLDCIAEAEIWIAPLRERPDDISAMIGFFFRHYSNRFAHSIKRISLHAFDRLKDHRWPGNVRELKNAIESAVLLANDYELDVSDIPVDWSETRAGHSAEKPANASSPPMP